MLLSEINITARIKLVSDEIEKFRIPKILSQTLRSAQDAEKFPVFLVSKLSNKRPPDPPPSQSVELYQLLLFGQTGTGPKKEKQKYYLDLSVL
jgi:hypothetical protein